jgi:hypothetical protein
MQLSNFLRIVLKLDAASCLGIAALVLPTAAGLQDHLGIEQAALSGAAASLIPTGLFMLWLGSRREAPVALVWLAIIGNAGWAAGSLFAAAGMPGITSLGQAAVAGQGLAVAGLAFAEWTGLRQVHGESLQGA